MIPRKKKLCAGTMLSKTLKTAKITVYIRRVLIATSVGLNVLTGGYSNQTFSARNWAWHREGRRNIVSIIDALFGSNHCMESWTYWVIRKRKKGKK